MPIASPGRHPIHKKSSLKRQSIGSPAISSPLRPTDRATNIMNDDAAERASRRKSAHFGDLGIKGGDGEARKEGQKRHVSAMAVQAAQQGQGHKKAKRLSAVAPAAAPIVSMEVMNTNFEEWMKLATDNKITANNTWNFALIDYFADLTLLRNDEDQSINFQKASCTLDGCVKIWTSRVDSVATETGKLLSGLAGGGGGEDQDDDGVEGDDDEEGGEVRKTRKSARSEATLAKSFATLQIKKFDLEFTVDPLFKKTSADFDEGGAMGLLMNHLGVDGKGRVVFDAGDAVAEEDEEQEQEEDEMIDITKLRSYMPTLDKTMTLAISDTLSSFRFSSDPNSMPDFATLVGLKDSYADDVPAGPSDEYGNAGEAHDFFGDEDFDTGAGMGGFDDGASAGGDDDAGQGYGEGGFVAGPSGGVGLAAPGDIHAPFDPRRQGGELVMALVGGGEEEGMFDYFDKGFGKSWAGAEHWKLRKVSRKDPSTSTSTRVAKTAKAPFTIDFAAPATAFTSSKALFAPAARSTITMASSSKTKRSSKKSRGEKEKREEWLLPDDMHFSSRQLLRLFLKPKFALRMRKATTSRLTENANGEIDENFWAQAAADRADLENGGEGQGDDGTPVPFESQFFHDDMDDGFADDGLGYDGETGMAIGGDEEDLWQGTQGQKLKKSRPENVHFAKKAKRVDVKRLKDDIWTGLRTLVPPESHESEEEAEPTTPVAPVKTFDSIIQDLRTTYPQEKMSEISTSFCFICLLHLANEEGLRIETGRYDGNEGEDVGCMGSADFIEDEADDPAGKWKGRKMDAGEREDRIVGELQALKVFKDPNAGRAA